MLNWLKFIKETDEDNAVVFTVDEKATGLSLSNSDVEYILKRFYFLMPTAGFKKIEFQKNRIVAFKW